MSSPNIEAYIILRAFMHLGQILSQISWFCGQVLAGKRVVILLFCRRKIQLWTFIEKGLTAHNLCLTYRGCSSNYLIIVSLNTPRLFSKEGYVNYHAEEVGTYFLWLRRVRLLDMEEMVPHMVLVQYYTFSDKFLKSVLFTSCFLDSY